MEKNIVHDIRCYFWNLINTRKIIFLYVGLPLILGIVIGLWLMVGLVIEWMVCIVLVVLEIWSLMINKREIPVWL